MKKMLITVLTAVLLCAMAVGCGGSSETAATTAPITEAVTVPTTEAATVPTTEPVETFRVHVHVHESWGNASIWAWSDSHGDLFGAWPGEAMAPEGEGWYTYDVPEWVEHLIISGLGGSVKSENIDIEAKEVWIALKEDGTARVEYEAFEIPKDGYIETLTGKRATLNRNGGNFPALICTEPVKDCYQLTVTLDVTMKAGARCKEWNLLGITGQTTLTVDILGKIILPEGDGKVTQTFYFDKPVNFEALCVEPTIPGGYSWTQTTTYTDVWTLPQE